jgi:hypothetical protein
LRALQVLPVLPAQRVTRAHKVQLVRQDLSALPVRRALLVRRAQRETRAHKVQLVRQDLSVLPVRLAQKETKVIRAKPPNKEGPNHQTSERADMRTVCEGFG